MMYSLIICIALYLQASNGQVRLLSKGRHRSLLSGMSAMEQLWGGYMRHGDAEQHLTDHNEDEDTLYGDGLTNTEYEYHDGRSTPKSDSGSDQQSSKSASDGSRTPPRQDIKPIDSLKKHNDYHKKDISPSQLMKSPSTDSLEVHLPSNDNDEFDFDIDDDKKFDERFGSPVSDVPDEELIDESANTAT